MRPDLSDRAADDAAAAVDYRGSSPRLTAIRQEATDGIEGQRWKERQEGRVCEPEGEARREEGEEGVGLVNATVGRREIASLQQARAPYPGAREETGPCSPLDLIARQFAPPPSAPLIERACARDILGTPRRRCSSEVEQLFRKQQVEGSNPPAGSIRTTYQTVDHPGRPSTH